MSTFQFDWESFRQNKYSSSALSNAFLPSENKNGVLDEDELRRARENRLRERGYTEETARQAMLDKKLSLEEYCKILNGSG